VSVADHERVQQAKERAELALIAYIPVGPTRPLALDVIYLADRIAAKDAELERLRELLRLVRWQISGMTGWEIESALAAAQQPPGEEQT